MDHASAFTDATRLSPGTILVLVGVLVALAAARAAVVLFRLIGLLVRSIVQLLRSLVILSLAVALIAGWVYERARDAQDVQIEAPAQAPPSIAAPGAVPSIGPIAPHK